MHERNWATSSLALPFTMGRNQLWRKNRILNPLYFHEIFLQFQAMVSHDFAMKILWKRRNKKWERFFKNDFDPLCHPKAILKVKQKDLCSVPLSLLNLKVRRIRNDFFKPTFLPKNERTNLTLLLVDLFSIVFWKKVKTPKKHFEINWPLLIANWTVHLQEPGQ